MKARQKVHSLVIMRNEGCPISRATKNGGFRTNDLQGDRRGITCPHCLKALEARDKETSRQLSNMFLGIFK